MTSSEEQLNSLNKEIAFWQDFTSYKKALYLTQNAPDCCFVLNLDSNNSKTFYAHKSILQSASPVFETLFPGKIIEVKISNTDPQVFKKFLDFLYYGDVDNLNCADAGTLRNLISLGKHYKVDNLIKNCIGIMKLNLVNAENYDLINTFEYACLMEDSELIAECKRVIVGRTKSSPTFQDFNLNQQQDEKRHIVHARKQLTGPHGNSNKLTNGNANAPASDSTFGFTSSASSSESNGNSTANKTQPNTTGGAQNIFGNSSKPIFGGGSSSIAGFGSSQTQQPSAGNSQSQLHSFSFAVTPTVQPTEEKLQNTDTNKNEKFGGNLFNLPIMPLGVNKGKITECACIYGLNPSVFYEFQITLSGHISELLRFNMIETYAKINGLMSDDVDCKFKELAQNKDANLNIINTEDAPLPELQKQSMTAVSKQILNMMLRSIKFHRMTAKEFCSGPGKSSLLEMSEKYDLLVTIVNKN